MIKTIVVASAFAAALSASAHTQEASVTVGYGDLDLTSEAGVARLDRRIEAAVDQVCGDHRDQIEFSAFRAVRRCSRATLEEVASPRRIAIERARGKLPSVEFASARDASAISVRRR